SSGPSTAQLAWSTVGNTVVDVRYRAVGAVDWIDVSGVAASPLQVEGLAGCQAYEFQVRAQCGVSQSAYSASHTWTSEGCCAIPLALQATRTAPTAITLQWTGVPAATTYDLRYREVGIATWIQLNGITQASTLLDGLANCTNYEFQVRSACTNGPTAWSASVLRNTAGCEQCMSDAFCPSVAEDASAEWIQRVSIGAIDNTSGNNDGYASFTNTNADITVGVLTPIVLEPGYAGTAYTEYFTVWMDLDRDGQYTEDERVLDPGAGVVGPLTTTITLPLTPPGPIRMRVIMRFDNPVDNGCVDGYDFGETEDYCLTVTDNPGGIADGANAGTVQVYPVPADQRVTFQVGNNASGQVQVMDAAGRIIAAVPVRGGAATFDTTTLGAGAYLYRITEGASVKARGAFVVAH
ncbi:MAG TPA: GEVED domain-containing protein, partial [Flavobacteriales bacterium]|nr:GEVED domain-containing protein [Flavobacteriales bacterium]